ncbi:hypothetical protein [Streptomyces sp. NPDC087300]|uniref:hypothetical protein n=1 Tax=Streptomyces sp. NPDC087300 TaxID=3365780 RepID=UPI0038076D22
MARIHVLFARKGGVGKSFLAIAIATVCAEILGPNPDGSAKVAVASADPQGTSLWRAAQLTSVPFDTIDISDDLENIHRLKDLPYSNIFVDTPGWTPPKLIEFENGANALGNDDRITQLLEAILDQADDAMVPMLCEKDSFSPTEITIDWVLRPRGIPHIVVINKWLPNKEEAYVEGTRGWCEAHGYAVARTAPRRYRVHANGDKLITDYLNNRMELQAKLDVVNLAMEHGLTRAAHMVKQLEAAERALAGVRG